MGEPSVTRHGILIVDKPARCTSHDVVQRIRKALGQRSVGHAGTLDPLATGVLVVAVGEGTKLVSYLQSQDKRYEVTIALGVETDSLDADGHVVATADAPQLEVSDVARELERLEGTHLQEAPKLSAIKVGGRPLHRRARAGEEVTAPAREVTLYEGVVESVDADEITLRLHCGKGFYVRSLARDLCRGLGTVGHVKALRRTASGPFDLQRALPGDALTADRIAKALIPLGDACAVLPRVELTEAGATDARHGRPIGPEAVKGVAWRSGPPEQTFVLFDPAGEPVAIGRRAETGLRVVRGFTTGRSGVVSR